MPYLACGSVVSLDLARRASAISVDRAVEHLGHARLDALGRARKLGRHAEAQARAGRCGDGSAISPGRPSAVESQGSLPTSCPISSAASVTSRVSGPHWSSEDAKAIMP